MSQSADLAIPEAISETIRSERREPIRAALELLLAVGLIEICLWPPAGTGGTVARALATALLLALIAASQIRRQGTLRIRSAFPERRSSAARGWLLAIIATLLAVVVVISSATVLGVWIGTWSAGLEQLSVWEVLGDGIRKVVSVFAQQVALQLFVVPLCLELVDRRGLALGLAASIYGGLHYPNLLLVFSAGAMSLIWMGLYRDSLRLLPVGVSHLVLAMVMGAAFGEAVYDMRVGAAAASRLPHTLRTLDGTELHVRPGSVEGYVDRCLIRDGHATCSGWSADVERAEVAEVIFVLVDQTLYSYAMTGQLRPGVVEFFGKSQLARSGFRLELPSEWFVPNRRARFFGMMEDSRVSELRVSPDYLDSQ